MRLNCIAPGKSRVVASAKVTGFSSPLCLIFAIFLTGCHPLPPGDISAVARPAGVSRVGRVYLIRGWRDLWSEGIDKLAGELRERGVDAQAYRAAQWRDLADAIEKTSSSEPLVLIGFSYGADDAIEISRKLHRPVDLVIAVDPVTPPVVPANVRRCYDYYQTNGVWDVFPWLRGIPLRSEDASKLTNVDLRKARPDLVEADTSHSTIAADPKLHREFVGKVLEVCGVLHERKEGGHGGPPLQRRGWEGEDYLTATRQTCQLPPRLERK
jgi:pimeloyl-ACP methyl ester carboxylesterase